MITRRCTQRQFLLRPDSATNNAFVYCLAAAAQRSGVLLLFSAAQSNHHHTGIYDPNGTYPDFIEHFHKLLAKCMNSLRGRWENFWSSEQTSVLHLVEPADVLDKMVYALTNPVKDNLVARVTDWPVASGDRGYHFRQHHRVPGAHPVARRQSSALPVGRRIGVGHLPSWSMAGRG
jgi:hypothetical protein